MDPVTSTPTKKMSLRLAHLASNANNPSPIVGNSNLKRKSLLRLASEGNVEKAKRRRLVASQSQSQPQPEVKPEPEPEPELELPCDMGRVISQEISDDTDLFGTEGLTDSAPAIKSLELFSSSNSLPQADDNLGCDPISPCFQSVNSTGEMTPYGFSNASCEATEPYNSSEEGSIPAITIPQAADSDIDDSTNSDIELVGQEPPVPSPRSSPPVAHNVVAAASTQESYVPLWSVPDSPDVWTPSLSVEEISALEESLRVAASSARPLFNNKAHDSTTKPGFNYLRK